MFYKMMLNDIVPPS